MTSALVGVATIACFFVVVLLTSWVGMRVNADEAEGGYDQYVAGTLTQLDGERNDAYQSPSLRRNRNNNPIRAVWR